MVCRFTLEPKCSDNRVVAQYSWGRERNFSIDSDQLDWPTEMEFADFERGRSFPAKQWSMSPLSPTDPRYSSFQIFTHSTGIRSWLLDLTRASKLNMGAVGSLLSNCVDKSRLSSFQLRKPPFSASNQLTSIDRNVRPLPHEYFASTWFLGTFLVPNQTEERRPGRLLSKYAKSIFIGQSNKSLSEKEFLPPRGCCIFTVGQCICVQAYGHGSKKRVVF